MASGELVQKRTQERVVSCPVPQANSVTVGRENKLYELRYKLLFKVYAERVLVHVRVNAEEGEDRRKI